MTEFNASGNPRFPFELKPGEWERRVFLFTKAEAERHWFDHGYPQVEELLDAIGISDEPADPL